MIRKNNRDKRYQVSEIEDLFFYSLYMVKAYWVPGVVHGKTGRKIKQQCGYDVSDYKVMLRSEEIRHAFYEHFHETHKNQRNISVADVRNILSIVNYHDSVRPDLKNRLVFKKRTPNGSYTFVTQIDEKNKRLLGITFWITA